MRRQQPRDVGLHALFDLGTQGQPPIVEQVVIHARRRVLGAATVADQQDLAALFDPVCLAFLVAVVHTRRVPTAKPVSLAVQPGRPVLCAQTRQAMAKKARSQTFEPRHFGQGQKLGRKIGDVSWHADSRV
ncbi:hypothetical protein D3C85_1303110 [compost metagenome]